MKRLQCEWCLQDVPYDLSRVISEHKGHAILRDKQGRLHDLRPNKETESEQEESIGEETGTRSGKAVEEDSESETEGEREEFLQFSQRVLGE